MRKTLIPRITKYTTLLAFGAALTLTAQAQTTANWINLSGGDWNTAANWDLNEVPGVGTNVDLATYVYNSVAINYSSAMTAPSVGAVLVGNNSGGTTTLNIGAGGFLMDLAGVNSAPLTLNAGGVVNVNSGGVLTTVNGGPVTFAVGGALNISGSAFLRSATATQTNAPFALGTTTNALNIQSGGLLAVSDSGRISMGTASFLDVQGSLILTNNAPGAAGIDLGLNGNNGGAGLTNNGGTIISDQRIEMRGRYSRFIMNGGTLSLQGNSGVFESANDAERPWLINGGTADLGDFSVSRTAGGGGLIVSNGMVTCSSLRVGTANSRGYATIYGGVLTNTGAFYVLDRTNSANSGDRRIRFLVRGGSVVSTAPEGIIVVNQSQVFTNLNIADGVIGATLDINAGSVTAERITLIRDNTITNGHATLALAGTGIVYVGSGGIQANVGPYNTSYRINLNGGTLAAKDNYSVNGNVTLGGASQIFQAADAANAPFNITINGIVSGSTIVYKTGGGTLTFNTNNTYSGNTYLNEGTLALGANGSISSSSQIVLGSSTTFDVSGVTGGFVLNGLRTLSGFGQVLGDLSAAATSVLSPGTNDVTGTLTFNGDLTQSGDVLTHFDLSDSPAGANDFVSVSGDLNASGLNTIEISGSVASYSVYPLIQYGGAFNGSLTNFTLTGVTASLSNNPTTGTIYLVTESGIRLPTSITWVGNATANDWDLVNATNWLNAGVIDYFVAGDDVTFDETGAANPTVNIVGNVDPDSVTVNATSAYTFTGDGGISGSGTVLKTNSGTLTVLSTNTYTGPTILGGGWLEAATIKNNGVGSSIGAAPVDPANLVFNGGNLRYIGSSDSTDRGATLNADGTIDVSGSAATLSVEGTVAGNAGFTKVGSGTLVLSGANTYAGTTTISNGTLQINTVTNALGTNAVNLGDGRLFANVGGEPQFVFPLNLLSSGGLIDVAARNARFDASLWYGTVADTLNVNVLSNGYFTINTEISNFFGTINLGTSSGIFRFNSGGNDPCIGSSNITFDLGTGTGVLGNRNGSSYGTSIYFLGALLGGPETRLRGALSTGTSNFWEIGGNNLSTTYAGTITNGSAGGIVSIIKAGTGTLTLTGTNTYGGITVVSNGVLALVGGGSIPLCRSFRTVPDGVLNVSGRTDGTLTLGNNQNIEGMGTIEGSVVLDSGATMTPGDASDGSLAPKWASYVETINITNALTFLSGSTNAVDFDYDLFANVTNDLVTARSITYGGVLNLNFRSGIGGSLAVGNRFKLFNAASYSGAFESIIPAEPYPGLAWDTSQLTVNGTIGVITPPAPQPAINSVYQSGTDLIFSGTNGVASGLYYVISSTNLALPLDLWPAVATNYFLGDGSFSCTNGFDKTQREVFFLIRIPAVP